MCAVKRWGAVSKAGYTWRQCCKISCNWVRESSGTVRHCKQLKLQGQSLRLRCNISHSKPSASRRYFKIWAPATDRCFPRRQNVATVSRWSCCRQRMMRCFASFNQGWKCLLAMKPFMIAWCRPECPSGRDHRSGSRNCLVSNMRSTFIFRTFCKVAARSTCDTCDCGPRDKVHALVSRPKEQRTTFGGDGLQEDDRRERVLLHAERLRHIVLVEEAEAGTQTTWAYFLLEAQKALAQIVPSKESHKPDIL